MDESQSTIVVLIVPRLGRDFRDSGFLHELFEDLRSEQYAVLPLPLRFEPPWFWREWLSLFPHVDFGEWEYLVRRWLLDRDWCVSDPAWRHELEYILRRTRRTGEPRLVLLLAPFGEEVGFDLREWNEFLRTIQPVVVVDLRVGEQDQRPAEQIPRARILRYPEARSELLDLLRSFTDEAARTQLVRLSERHAMARCEFAERTARQERPKITVAYPEAVAPSSWSTVDVFLYLRDYREVVETEIRRLQDREGLDYSGVSSEFPKSLPPGCPIRISLQSDSLRTNPSELTINWYEPYNRLPFRISPVDETNVGYSASLNVDIFADDLAVASMRLAIAVNSNVRCEHAKRAASDAAWYEDIFASYARENLPIVRHLKERYEALGLYMFIDLEDLRSGAAWQTALREKISGSDLFQLFWSDHARQSKYVADEWRHALGLREVKGARFVRPVYWDEPIPPVPEDLADINFRKITFVQSLGAEPKDAGERG